MENKDGKNTIYACIRCHRVGKAKIIETPGYKVSMCPKCDLVFIKLEKEPLKRRKA